MLEKTLRGVRSIAPGLYRDDDPRGPAWEALLESEIGSLVADPDGLNAVDAKELNRRLFVVAQRLADDVMSMHLRALLEPRARMGLKRRLQSLYAVGMVAFLEIPYYFAWSFQSRDRDLQEELRAYFLGERRHTRREKVAVLCGSPPRSTRAPGAEGSPGESHPVAARSFLDLDVALLTCSVDSEPQPAGVVDFRALAWRPSSNGERPRWVIPPLVEVVDYLEEEEFSAVHTDSTAAQGLVALVAAKLLHLPVTGAVDPEGLEEPHGPGDIAGRLRRRYLAWFYGRLDEAYAPTRASARALVAAGVEPDRITLLPAPAADEAPPAGAEPGRLTISSARAGLTPRRRAARRRACVRRAGSPAPSARRRREPRHGDLLDRARRARTPPAAGRSAGPARRPRRRTGTRRDAP